MGTPTVKFQSHNPAAANSGCSGAPATLGPITGSYARTRNAAGENRVGFFEGAAPDFSAVPTDGTAVCRINTNTAGIRQNSSISTVKNTFTTGVGYISTASDVLGLTTGTTAGWASGDIISVSGGGLASATLYSRVMFISSSTGVVLQDTAGTTVISNAYYNPKQIGYPSSEGTNTGAAFQTWAIGGYLSSLLAGGQSRLLLENNGAAGDAPGGWTLLLTDGHWESTANIARVRSNGTASAGRLIISGPTGATLVPTLSFSNNAAGFIQVGDYAEYKNFRIDNTSSTKTASIAIDGQTSSPTFLKISNMIFGDTYIPDTGNRFWKGIVVNAEGTTIDGCEIIDTISNGIEANTSNVRIINNYLHGCSGIAISTVNITAASMLYYKNIIYKCGAGIHIDSNVAASRPYMVMNNTIDLCNWFGIRIMASSGETSNFANTMIENNQITNNGITGSGYALWFSDSSVNADVLTFLGASIRNNNSFNNNQGFCNFPLSTSTEFGTTALNPQYINPTGGNFIMGNLAARNRGFPLGGALNQAAVKSVVDQGAIQGTGVSSTSSTTLIVQRPVIIR